MLNEELGCSDFGPINCNGMIRSSPGDEDPEEWVQDRDWEDEGVPGDTMTVWPLLEPLIELQKPVFEGRTEGV